MITEIRFRRTIVAVAASLAVFLAASAQASINYGSFVGDQVSFIDVIEGSATDPLPLFGAPNVVGDSLVFTPVEYIAVAEGPGSDITTATLNMMIAAKDGGLLQTIMIREFGDTGFTGLGGANAATSVIGTMFVSFVQNNQFITLPASQLIGNPSNLFNFPPPNGQGVAWSGVATINLAQLEVQKVTLTFDNVLTAVASSGGAAFIEKKGVVIDVTVPEPASLSLMAAGALLIGWRKRVG